MLEIQRTDPVIVQQYETHMPEGAYDDENTYCIEVVEKLPGREDSHMGIMYVVKMWEGVAISHAYLGPHIWGKQPIKMVRGVTRKLDEAAEVLNVWRIQAESPYNAPRYSRWLTLLGFKLEAQLRKYYPNGEDAWILAKFYERNEL